MTDDPIKIINKDINGYLISLYECTPHNLRRLDKGLFNYEGFVRKNAPRSFEIPYDTTTKWVQEGVEEHFQESAFLIKEFKRLGYKIIPTEDLSIIDKMLDKGFENLDKRDFQRYFEKLKEKMTKLMRVSSLPSNKEEGFLNEKLREQTTPFKKRLRNIEPKALEGMLDFYKDYFEYVVNRTLRELYQKYTKKYEKGTNTKLDNIIKESPNYKKISNYKLIEFFKEAWKESSFLKKLSYFMPVIRNAITHDIGNDVDINYTDNKMKFTSGKYHLTVSIDEFIAKYWSSAVSVYQTLANLIPRYQTLLEIEKDFVIVLLNEEGEESRFKRTNPLPFYYASPELKLFGITFNKLLKAQGNKEYYSEFYNEIAEFLLIETTARNNISIIPYLIRFLLSDYPFNKPKLFKRKICEIYSMYVELSFFQDDIDLLQGFLKK